MAGWPFGGYPPKAPTDPYVRTLTHTAPRYKRFATLGRPHFHSALVPDVSLLLV